MGIRQHMEPECPQNGGARCSPGVQIPGRAFVCRGRSTRGESTARVRVPLHGALGLVSRAAGATALLFILSPGARARRARAERTL